MQRRRRLLVCLAILIAPATASAQTLKDALSLAYQTNPTLAAERARHRATSEAKAQALASVLPTVSASGSYGRLDDTSAFNGAAFGGGPGSVTRQTDLSPLAGQIEAEQTLFAGFRNFNAIKAAAARVRADGARLAGVEQRLLLEAGVAYFDVMRDQAIFNANANQASVLARQYEEAKARLNVGEVTRTDVSQSEARLAQARAALSGAGAALAASRAAFVRVVGEAPASLETAPAMPSTPATLEDALAAARALSPSILAAKEASDAARRSVAVAKGSFAPSISAYAGYSYAEEQNAFIVSSKQGTYGLRAQVPIFNGGLNLSRVREAKAQADAARSDVDGAERQAAADATAAFERVSASRATIAAARAQVEANRTALAGVRRESEVGARTTLDVLDAEQELLNAEVALARAERDERASIFSLLAAVGALTPESLQIVPAP